MTITLAQRLLTRYVAMSSPILIDTAGWASLFVRSEPYHVRAQTLFNDWRKQDVPLITTNYILAELIALFTSPLRVPRARQIQYIDTIKATVYISVIHIDVDLDAAAWALLKSRHDKNWSLVDATSFVVMSNRGINAALTTDQHFEQAGFTRLLTS